ncbi:hypothetical protein IW147_006051 [Coemansia sp. RSA 720]|nr:hypothetical protein IW147_006051 [Coemansia sp. RSA 720]
MSDTTGQHSTSVSRESSVGTLNSHGTYAASNTPLASMLHSQSPQNAQPDDRDSSSPRFLRACDNCRRRKVKCDGVRPSCSHCRRVDAPCHYSVKPKSRRMWKCLETPEVGPPQVGSSGSAAVVDKQSADSTTAKLLARVETMERLLMQRNGVNSPRVPVVSADDAGNVGGAMFPTHSGHHADSVFTGAQFHAGMASRRESESQSADAPQRLGSALSGERQGAVGDTSSALLGGLSPDLVNDLINTLFSNGSDIIELINEKSFRRQFAAGTISPLLLHSALAAAARYSSNPAVRTDPPSSAPAPFISRAKTLVVDALEEPSLGNAQGLMIMCMMYFGLGNEVITTSYKSLALNMCIMLGFNRLDSVNGPVQPNTNCTHDYVVTSTMSMDWTDREAARRLWWTIFSIENYSSVCMGLAPSIQAEYCDVTLPASTAEWVQGKSRHEHDGDSPAKRLRIDENPLQQLSAYHAQLSLIFSKVAWLVTHTNSDTEGSVAQFGELNTVLQRWYEGLPSELRLSSVDTLLHGSHNSSDYYHVCVLHMRFYATVIQLNHAIPEFTEDAELIGPGQRKCVIAASRISDLLRSSFDISVEMRDINWYMCVFRAAHIHIYRLLSRDSESIARAKQDLAVHRRHLREGGPLWRICYKLLNRLDDMEQMVLLLPAQIPVADLVKIKNLTRKGKSQLVNMQLDALIKPALIRSDHADTAEAAGAQAVSAGLYNMAHPQSSSPMSTASGSTSTAHPFTPLTVGAQVSLPVSNAAITPFTETTSFAETTSPLAFMDAQLANSVQFAKDTMPVSTPLMQIANDMPKINTNIVIDNDMAETLVNYFYMVASNTYETHSPAQGPSQMPQLHVQNGPAVLASPQLMGSGVPPMAAQPLLSSAYDLSRLQSLADDNSRSFI